jgi:hypothetical protein
MTDDEKPRIHEQDPTLLAPASRPSVPSAGKPVKAATARSFNRDTGEWTYRPKNVKPPCGKWFAEGGNDFKCALKQGHEQHFHGLCVPRIADIPDTVCGRIGGTNVEGIFVCGKPKGHDRHRPSLKAHGESTLADIGYVTNSARAMTGEPENTDYHTQQQYAERAQIHAVQQQVARTADRAPDRELLTRLGKNEQRAQDAERRVRRHGLGRVLSQEVKLMRQLLDSQRDADRNRGMRKLRIIEQRLDEVA